MLPVKRAEYEHVKRLCLRIIVYQAQLTVQQRATSNLRNITSFSTVGHNSSKGSTSDSSGRSKCKIRPKGLELNTSLVVDVYHTPCT